MGVAPTVVFWPAAAALAAVCAVLVLWFAARAAKRATAVDESPARAVYRRQLADLDEMSDQGLLAPEEREAARAEAARRLLAEPGAPPERTGVRLAPLAAAALAALAALGLYMWQGSPGQGDQPYRARLEQWRHAPVSSLAPDQVAAVLREVAKGKPNDPRLLALLGKVERAAGDPIAAVQYLQRAARLEPANADAFADLGDALTAAGGGKPTPQAEAALNHALELDPKNQAALYYLGAARANDGDPAGAAGLWRRLAENLPEGDPRRAPLLAMVEKVEKGEPVGPAEPGAGQPTTGLGGDQAGFIKGMVASLQAKLDASPDDPAGWARLVRSYHVLGDQSALDRSLARARAQFKGQPDKLGPIEAAAK